MVKRKPGLRAGFGKQLTERIDAIEDLIAAHTESLEELQRKMIQLSGAANGLEPSNGIQGLPYLKQEPSPSVIGSENHTVGASNLSPQNWSHLPVGSSSLAGQSYSTNAPQSQLVSQQSPTTSLQTPQSATLHQSSYSPEEPVPKKRRYSQVEKEESALKFLTPEIAKTLICLYFKQIHCHFPILHEETTKTYLFAVCTNEEWPLLLHAIIAVTIRFLPRESLSLDKSETIYQSCKDSVILHSLNITTVERLQALVVLAMDMAGRSNGPQTWGIMALISAGAIHLGICREESSAANGSETMGMKGAELLSSTSDFMEQESRRRLFWGIYMLDKFSSVATSFSFKLNETEIDRLLPIKESLWKHGDQMNGDSMKTRWLRTSTRKDYQLNATWAVGYFGFAMEILQILGMIHDFLRKPVNIHSLNDVVEWQMRYRQLDSEIDEWYQGLPEDIRRSDSLKDRGNNVMLTMLLSIYYTTIIRLHSSAGYAYLKSEFFTSSPLAAQKCLVAARAVVSIAREVNLLGLWQDLGPQYAFMLWVSSRLLLVDCVTSHKSLPSELEVLLATLHQMGKYWEIASRYWEIITLVVDEELALRKEKPGVSTDSEESDRKRLSSAQILSDMGRNAYALDFLLYKEKGKDQKENGHTDKSDQPQAAATPAQGASQQQLSSSLEPDNFQGMFEWFNWPKPFGSDLGTTTPTLHSLDGYKNILSRDDFADTYGLMENQKDWLGK
jgi:hypothetical protein